LSDHERVALVGHDLEVDRFAAHPRRLDRLTRRLLREQRVELGEEDLPRRGGSGPRKIRKARDADGAGDEVRPLHRETRRRDAAEGVTDQPDARPVDRKLLRKFIDERLEQVRADAERDRRRAHCDERLTRCAAQQRSSAVPVEEHVLVGTCSMQGDHERERPVALRHELPDGKLGSQDAVDAPDVAVNREGTLPAFRALQRRLDAVRDTRQIGDQRRELGPVDLLAQKRGPGAQRGRLRLVDRAFGGKRRHARLERLPQRGEVPLEHRDAGDLDLADELEPGDEDDVPLRLRSGKLELDDIGVRDLVTNAVDDRDHRHRLEPKLHAREFERLERQRQRLADHGGARRRHVAVPEEELQLFLPDLVEPLKLAVQPRDLGQGRVELTDEEVARQAVEAAVRPLPDDRVVRQTGDEPLETLVAEGEIAAVGRRAERDRCDRSG